MGKKLEKKATSSRSQSKAQDTSGTGQAGKLSA